MVNITSGKGPLRIGEFVEGIIGGLAVYIIIYIIRDELLLNLDPFHAGIAITFGWATVWWVRKSSLHLFDKYAKGNKLIQLTWLN